MLKTKIYFEVVHDQCSAVHRSGPEIPVFLLASELQSSLVIGSTSLNCKVVLDLNPSTEREYLNSVILQAGLLYVVMVVVIRCFS